jgi:hypothetical protein
MKITLCGSTAFISEMEEMANRLEVLGHEVKFPPVKFVDGDGKEWQTKDYYVFKKTQPFSDKNFLKNHTERIRAHFDKVAWADVILVTNFDKNGIQGYVGPNTLMEMGVAFYLQKPIYLLNSIPEVAWKEEIVGMKPVLILGDLDFIK